MDDLADVWLEPCVDDASLRWGLTNTQLLCCTGRPLGCQTIVIF